ncbi:MAG: histidine kinase [Gammaproteobacteria bacterium]|nr:histidine kinase [Gammaproteobacteria bacterium]
MTGPYAYTPYIWPMLASPALLLPAAVHAWRHRSAPGAVPFVVFVLCAAQFAGGAALELAAVDVSTKVFWDDYQNAFALPAVIASLWFALEYSGHVRLTRRVAALAAAPWLLVLAIVLAGQTRPLLCTAYTVGAQVHCAHTRLAWALTAYGFALSVAATLVFVWLFATSPLHRWPAAVCIVGHLAARAGFVADRAGASPFAPVDAMVLGHAVTAMAYAVALFGYRLFELIPVARGTLVEQMREGVLVIDPRLRLVDANPAGERALGLPLQRARGRLASELLPALPAGFWPAGPGVAHTEVALDTGAGPRRHALRVSPLERHGGFRLGYLVVLYDVTEQREAEQRAVDHQRALATLRERDRVARELHDSLGQVLGYAKMQAQAARERLARGEGRQADDHLAQLVAVAQDAHADVRDYILGARAAGSAEADFLPSLEDYLRRFRANYGIDAALEASPELAGRVLEPMVGAQLLRMLQEALTNVRKHARASRVRIGLSLSDGRATAVVEDDGEGFDAGRTAAAEASTFGLGFMRERAHEVGGTVEVHSAAGQGTRVVINVPLQGRST